MRDTTFKAYIVHFWNLVSFFSPSVMPLKGLCGLLHFTLSPLSDPKGSNQDFRWIHQMEICNEELGCPNVVASRKTEQWNWIRTSSEIAFFLQPNTQNKIIKPVHLHFILSVYPAPLTKSNLGSVVCPRNHQGVKVQNHPTYEPENKTNLSRFHVACFKHSRCIDSDFFQWWGFPIWNPL